MGENQDLEERDPDHSSDDSDPTAEKSTGMNELEGEPDTASGGDGLRKKDSWDKVKIVGTLVAGVLTPLAIGLLGFLLNSSIKERESRVRLVELAIGILRQDPAAKNDTQTPELRKWAIEVVNSYSGVPLGKAAAELRVKPLPETTLQGQESLLTEVTVNTAEPSSGRTVNGFEVFAAPTTSSASAIKFPKLSSPTSMRLWRGIYYIWAAKGTLKGEKVRVDLISSSNSTVTVPIPH